MPVAHTADLVAFAAVDLEPFVEPAGLELLVELEDQERPEVPAAQG